MSRLPAVRDGLLRIAPHATPLRVGTPEWFAWLDDARSFTFASPAGTFTARHEERSGRRFWYAYRQQDGVLRKTYLGRSADLTAERLEAAGETLARKHSAVQAVGERQDAWAAPLIATKITMPPPGLALVARPAVVARCLESIERSCAILAAPAGFGKTTVLLMACERLRERGWDAAWVALEETERDPVRFWTYALAALGGVRPGVGTTARRMLETPRPQPIERVLTALINELATATTPIALVLDDYHRAATPASDASLAFLIEHAPAALHIVIATRSDPELPLTRLRAQGRIAELHVADLRFTREESERFLRDTMRVSLPAEQLARLEERTEGWVAGLQLAALSLRDQAAVPDLPADTATTPRYIAEYLIAEVLEHQPADVQAFLLQTSPLERLTGPLCDAVTGRTDSATVLDHLMRAQFFVTPLDPSRTWYRYHHLFAEVLRERLERTAPEVAERCHRRAAEWLRQQGMAGETIRHLLAARAYDEAATLLEGESDRLVLRGEVSGLVAYTRALPHAVILAHPHLCVLTAASLLLSGESSEAAAWLDDLERHVAEMGTSSTEIAGEIIAVRATVTMMTGDFTRGVTQAREALNMLGPQSQLLRGLALWLINVVGMLGDDNLVEVERTVGEMAEESFQAGNMLVGLMALAAQAAIQLYQGALHRAAQTCRDFLRLAPRVDGYELPIAAMAHGLLGEIRREWNDLEAAESDLRQAVAVGTRLGAVEFIDDSLVSLAMVLAARGQPTEALATFEELRHLVLTRQLPSWDMEMLESMRVRVLVTHGRTAEAALWAEASLRGPQEGKASATFSFLRQTEDLTLARVALATGCAGDVLAPMEEVKARAARAGRGRYVLEARMLLARARWMLGDTAAALRELDAALALAAPEGFVRVFLDEGAPLADLLAAYVAARPPSPARAHAVRLLAAFGRAVEPDTVPQAGPLSSRELDVLRLLASGHSNAAIADELIVAPSTAKWHIAQIYRKLGVSGRVQAVARARDLHLIA